MIYLELLISYLKIGFLGFGGGYAMLSFIQYEVVIHHEWITGSQFADIIALSQMTPGPIAINSATYIGYIVGGFWGSVVATIAVCTPAMTLMIFVTKSFLYLRDNIYVTNIMKAMRPVVIGMIGSAGISLIFPEDRSGESFVDIWSWVLFALAFIAVASKKVSLILIIALSALAGICIYYLPTVL
ncbi:MAG: chromate transporter [Rikenellaceae bacterium]